MGCRGPVTASVYNSVAAKVKSFTSEPVPDSDRIQQVSRLERLKSLYEDAELETEQQKEELRRRAERLNALAERGRKEEKMEEQK